MLILVPVVAVWLALAYLHAGLSYAELQESTFQKDDWRIDHDRQAARGNMAASWLFGLIPIFWLVLPFLTGFYQHGWLRPILAPAALSTPSTAATHEPKPEKANSKLSRRRDSKGQPWRAA